MNQNFKNFQAQISLQKNSYSNKLQIITCFLFNFNTLPKPNK